MGKFHVEFEPTPADQIACIAREIAMRERVYPKWVAAGKMKQAAADREIATMRAVLGEVERRRKAEAELAQTQEQAHAG